MVAEISARAGARGVLDLPEIWSGVYSSFVDVPLPSGDAHSTEFWAQRLVERHLQFASSPTDSAFGNSNPFPALLPLLGLKDEGGGKARVLDFGGGTGLLGEWVKRMVPNHLFQWNVLERPEVIHHPGLKQIQSADFGWFTELPEGDELHEVIVFGSSIQYLENISDEIGRLLQATRASWLVILDALVSREIETFVSRQNYYSWGMPVKFRSYEDFESEFRSLGFSIVSVSPALNNSNRAYYPSRGLPASHQIDYPLDLVLKRD